MSSNNFEKQVQKKMQELQLSPSKPVWEHIELGLQQHKKRRRWLWLPLFLLCLSVSGYFMFVAKSNTNSPTNSKQLVATSSQNSTTNKSSTKKAVVLQAPSEIDHTNSSIVKKVKKNIGNKKSTEVGDYYNYSSDPVSKIPLSEINEDRLPALSKKGSFDKERIIDNTSSRNVDDIFEERKVKTRLLPTSKTAGLNGWKKARKKKYSYDEDIVNRENYRKADVNDGHKLLEHITEMPLPVTEKLSVLDNVVDSVRDKQLLNEEKAAIILSVTTKTVAIEISKKAKRKWHWYFVASAGLSLQMERIGFENSKASFDAMSININNAPPSLMSSAGYSLTGRSPIQQEPAHYTDPSASFAFRVGVEAETKITKRSTIRIGLIYQQFGTAIKTGTLINSSQQFDYNYTGMVNGVQNFYVSGNSNNFTNRYSFLQLPVSFSTRLFNSKRLPLHWLGGVSLQYLFDSKALVYDKVNLAFYKNNKLLQKVQWGVNTSLEARLFPKSRHTLLLGPEVQLNLSSLSKEAYANFDQFLYLGVKLSLPFGKN